MNRFRLISFLISALVHLAILFCGNFAFMEQAKFGIQKGKESLEVDLVASIPEEAQKPLESQPHPIRELPKMDDVMIPRKEMPVVIQQSTPALIEHKSTVVKSDSSPPQPGSDSTTMKANRGAVIAATSDYLQNPPPVYPEVARRARQQGLVQLLVKVSEAGEPKEITVEQSSGFKTLDTAAVKAVRDWKFRPATLSGLAIESVVEVPIRFELQKGTSGN